MPITFSSPRAQLEVVYFLVSNESHIFLTANLKFRLQTPCSFGDTAGKWKLIGIPINNFLRIYIIASSPGLHTLFCLWRVNKKLPQGETSQNAFGISHDRGGHLFPFLHKNLNLKYKTWLGDHTFFYMDLFHGNTNSRVKIYPINND